jgi:hypothetical protein
MRRVLEGEKVAQVATFLLSRATAILRADLIADGDLTTSFDVRTGSEGILDLV